MPPHAPRPPETEYDLGLEFYGSPSPGVGGRLKSDAADFQVREISAYPVPDPMGPYTIVRVESQNWEQHELGAAIARRLGISPHSIQWAGTKDRRAIAERLFSFKGVPPSNDFTLPEVTFLEWYRARDGLSLGHHYGNAFAIRLRDVSLPVEEAARRCQSIRSELRDAGGFPNFFGLQRFGEVRPVTHLVGRRLVQGDVAGAVDLYLTEIAPNDAGPGVEARRAYALHRDPKRALQEFPPSYRFERTMLDHLARGQSPERALRSLSRELRLLFIHAYQAWLFNRWLSRRFREGIPMTEPVAGDWIIRVHRDGTYSGADAVPVLVDNRPECEDQVSRGRAQIAGPLVGFGTSANRGPPGDLLDALLHEEGIERRSFETPHTPEVASAGTWRPISLPLPPIGVTTSVSSSPLSGDNLTELNFRFALPKGAYATVLLREFQKSGALEA
ncbi:MAG: tRNA pseudouridine(13) synthase TruD [Thermoplasmata archaeon]